MKNLHPTWDRSVNNDQLPITVPGTNKKLKRKSREPKRLFRDPELERMKTSPADMSDVDSVDDMQTEAGNFSRLTSQQRQLLMPQEAMASTTGTLSGLPEGSMAPSQSGAIDMRIGVHVPAITTKQSQVSAAPFSNQEITHWPTAISQPLSNRLKPGLSSAFPLSTSISSTHRHSPSHQAFSLEPSLSGQTAAPSFPRASHTSQCKEHLDPQVESHKESHRKRVGVDGPGRLPELKAIQQTRRLLANARERTRVHTISAAFEALRKQVPCYSYGQKLSKLAILRIACNYILSLAQLAEMDYSSDHRSLSFSQCVEQCTRTLQAEGRSKKRKE